MKRLKSRIKLAWVVTLVVLVVAWRQKTTLPESSQISSELEQDPIQTMLTEDPFRFPYMGTTYIIEPVAQYDLRGLVVTHNNTQGWADIYHDHTSVDIKDLCVVWGDNVKGNLHRAMSFSSNTWTCYYRAHSQEDFRRFRGEQLSNNHLLSPHKKVRAKIFDTSIGDQVHLRGMLANYYPEGKAEMARRTSTVRDDTGNGACEVFFVESLVMIKKGNPGWHATFKISRILLFLFTVLFLAVFLYDVYADQHKI